MKKRLISYIAITLICTLLSYCRFGKINVESAYIQQVSNRIEVVQNEPSVKNNSMSWTKKISSVIQEAKEKRALAQEKKKQAKQEEEIAKAKEQEQKKKEASEKEAKAKAEQEKKEALAKLQEEQEQIAREQENAKKQEDAAAIEQTPAISEEIINEPIPTQEISQVADISELDNRIQSVFSKSSINEDYSNACRYALLNDIDVNNALVTLGGNGWQDDNLKQVRIERYIFDTGVQNLHIVADQTINSSKSIQSNQYGYGVKTEHFGNIYKVTIVIAFK